MYFVDLRLGQQSEFDISLKSICAGMNALAAEVARRTKLNVSQIYVSNKQPQQTSTGRRLLQVRLQEAAEVVACPHPDLIWSLSPAIVMQMQSSRTLCLLKFATCRHVSCFELIYFWSYWQLQTPTGSQNSSQTTMYARISASGITLPLAQVLSSFQQANEGSALQLIVTSISAEGLAGNNVCEIGELPGSRDDSPGMLSPSEQRKARPCESSDRNMHCCMTRPANLFWDWYMIPWHQTKLNIPAFALTTLMLDWYWNCGVPKAVLEASGLHYREKIFDLQGIAQIVNWSISQYQTLHEVFVIKREMPFCQWESATAG